MSFASVAVLIAAWEGRSERRFAHRTLFTRTRFMEFHAPAQAKPFTLRLAPWAGLSIKHSRHHLACDSSGFAFGSLSLRAQCNLWFARQLHRHPRDGGLGCSPRSGGHTLGNALGLRRNFLAPDGAGLGGDFRFFGLDCGSPRRPSASHRGTRLESLPARLGRAVVIVATRAGALFGFGRGCAFRHCLADPASARAFCFCRWAVAGGSAAVARKGRGSLCLATAHLGRKSLARASRRSAFGFFSDNPDKKRAGQGRVTPIGLPVMKRAVYFNKNRKTVHYPCELLFSGKLNRSPAIALSPIF